VYANHQLRVALTLIPLAAISVLGAAHGAILAVVTPKEWVMAPNSTRAFMSSPKSPVGYKWFS
jgi:hypothetical protein